MKKILFRFFVFLSVFFVYIFVSFAENSCKYQGKIDQCTSTIASFVGKNPTGIIKGGRIKSITDFPCIQDDAEMRAFQIVIDESFKKIDVEMEEYLTNLYTSKDFYFSEDGDFDSLDALGHIETLGDEFSKKFDAACSQSVAEVAACFDGGLTIAKSSQFISQSHSGACRKLARVKVKIFKQVATNGLLLNSSYLERDAKKKYNKQQRMKYDEVLDLMMLHLSYVERMWKKTSSLTKHVYGG